MAKKPQSESGKVKVRVLMDCEFGKVNQVVELDAEVAKAHADTVDANPAAVEYAESISKEK